MDLGENGLAVLDHLLARVSQDPIALAFQPICSRGIVGAGLGRVMQRAVDLDNQTALVVHEVRDEPTQRRLSADIELQLAKVSPQELLREGLFTTEMARASDCALAMQGLGGEGFTPIPNPSPIKGEGSLIALFDQASALSRST